jgi:cyclase
MTRARIIPVLLLGDGGLVKTVRFGKRRYVGDPINAVRIFNDKEVDELVLLDIDATAEGRSPNFAHVEEILSEAFMPVGYGGGVRSMADVERLFKLGVEKVVMNSILAESPQLLADASKAFGSQSVVASVDVKKDLLGRHRAYTHGGTRRLAGDFRDHLKRWQDLGAGEVALNSIDRDGTRAGLDVDLIRSVSSSLSVPLLAVGGAGTVEHLIDALRHGASAVGAGSMFIFIGVHQAVLINYVERSAFDLLNSAIHD